MLAGQEDYVVDALALHDHMHLLRPLLANPAVLKVHPLAACYTLIVRSCAVLLQSFLVPLWKA